MLARIIATLVCLLGLTQATTFLACAAFPAASAAWADDDDGGGDDAGGGRADDYDPPRAPRAGVPSAPRISAPRRAALPAFARDELVTTDLSEADLADLMTRGYAIVDETTAMGHRLRLLSLPAGADLAAAVEAVRALPSGAGADFNHYYRTEQAIGDNCLGRDCLARVLVGWPTRQAPDLRCGPAAPIGIVDTGINAGHSALQGQKLELVRIAPEGVTASRAVHGTAVVSLLIGKRESRSPGLVPEAQVIAVDAFYRADGDERADVFTLIEAMNMLAEKGVRVINLSFAGPPNLILERAVKDLNRRGIIMVGVAGNGGPRSPPAYPGAYPGVITVTAVERSGAVYRRAGQGAHIDIAAPGVDVWTAASVRGARLHTGTSFAAPFVTAAAAIMVAAEPDLTPAEVKTRLRSGARDMGDVGVDPVYGAGLLQVTGLCN